MGRPHRRPFIPHARRDRHTDTGYLFVLSDALCKSVCGSAGVSVFCQFPCAVFKDTTQRTTAEGYRLLVFTMNRLGLSTVFSLEYTPLWPWSGLGARPLGPRFITSQADIKKYPPSYFGQFSTAGSTRCTRLRITLRLTSLLRAYASAKPCETAANPCVGTTG